VSDAALRATGKRFLATARDGGIAGPCTVEWLFAAPVETTTDAEGAFAFRALGDDTFTLAVRTADDPPVVQTFEASSGVGDLELVLDPEQSPVQIGGQVRDARTHEPLRSFAVTLYRIEDGRHTQEARIPFEHSDGRFELPSTQPGTLRLFVEAREYRLGTTAPRDYASGRHEEAIELSPARSLLLRLTTEDGEPLGGATVRFTGDDGTLHWVESVGGSMQSVTSPESGEVFAHGLPSERITVGIYAQDRTRSWTRRFDVTQPLDGLIEVRLDRQGEAR
jgi:hypothetical protein